MEYVESCVRLSDPFRCKTGGSESVAWLIDSVSVLSVMCFLIVRKLNGREEDSDSGNRKH